MSRFLLAGPLLLVVGGSLMYHVAAKSVPKTLEPFAALIGVYTTALAASLAAYALARRARRPCTCPRCGIRRSRRSGSAC